MSRVRRQVKGQNAIRFFERLRESDQINALLDITPDFVTQEDLEPDQVYDLGDAMEVLLTLDGEEGPEIASVKGVFEDEDAEEPEKVEIMYGKLHAPMAGEGKTVTMEDGEIEEEKWIA